MTLLSSRWRNKLSAKEAEYMELDGAKKDGSCAIVNVSGGVSLDKGCCDKYKPVTGATSFCCGECVHSSEKSGS